MQHVSDEGRPADVGAIVEARLQIQMLGQGHDADRAHAGGEKSVHVADGQSGIGERAAGALGADLELRPLRRPARRMLVDAGDDGAIESAHRGKACPNSSSARLNAAGCSLVSMWPASSITAKCAPATQRCTSAAFSGGAK